MNTTQDLNVQVATRHFQYKKLNNYLLEMEFTSILNAIILMNMSMSFLLLELSLMNCQTTKVGFGAKPTLKTSMEII